MKKILSLTTIAIFTSACSGCQNSKKNNDLKQATQADSLQQVINRKDNEINDMMGTLSEIQEGSKEINTTENRATITKEGEGANEGQQIRGDIRFIASTMKRNHELTAKLRDQLKQSSMKGDGLKETLDSLTVQLEEEDKQLQELHVELNAKDIHISELDETTNNLNTNVNNLATESPQKSQVVNNQDKQFSAAWFVFGTRKELKEQRITEGDKVLQASFNKDYSTKIDIRVNKEIKLYSKSARVFTMRPSSSYLLQRDINKQYVLRITNPETSWSTSRYFVILAR